MLLESGGETIFVATGNQPVHPSRASVLFVHGTGQDHSIWLLPTRYFARHDRNVLAVDLPGHGRSSGAPLGRVEAIADCLIGVLDAAAVETAAIVGHSLGSLAALSAAARYPERVRAIALVGTCVPMPVSASLLEAAKNDRQEAIEMLTTWGFSDRAQLGGCPTPGKWMMGAERRLMERAAPGVIHADLTACNEYATGLEDAEKVRCPALLILGERDRLTPARSAQRLAATLPNAETVILKGCGHAMLAEQPDPVLDQLIKVV